MEWKNLAEIGRSLSLIFQLGIIIVFSIAICLYAGIKLDDWLQTRGIFTIAGVLLGIGAGFWECYLLITKTK